MRIRLGFVFLILAAALARPAVATEPPSPSEQARKHFEEGTKAFNLGEFQRAVTEYKAAYNAKPDPVFLYNIAQAYRLANDLNNALFFYRSFLRNAPDAPNRREVDGRIRTLEQQLAQQHALTQAPPNTPMGPSATTTPSPATKPAPEPEPAPAPPPAVVEKPAPTVPPPSEAAKAAEPPPPPSTTSNAVAMNDSGAAHRDRGTPVYKKWWLWTIVGVVVVGAAVGVGVGVAASSSPSPPHSALGTTTVF